MRKTITFDDLQVCQVLFGTHDENLQSLANEAHVQISTRGNNVILQGDDFSCQLVSKTLNDLYDIIAAGQNDIDVIRTFKNNQQGHNARNILMDTLSLGPKGRVIKPKSEAQRKYLKAMQQHDIVFAIGPAGTGKTYLAMAMAVSLLGTRQFSRMILARPAVEAGERLGFLPGDLVEKVNPYLRPLYDALHDMIEVDKTARWLDKGIIEVAPLAFMRGRTLNQAFVILDEAQNTTIEQMKMFLTRLGNDAKAIITGDVTQIDLPRGVQSGLVDAVEKLEHIDGIFVNRFDHHDVVRHPLVAKIVEAYNNHASAKA